MADFREISQEYAKQGINAAFLSNGGAAVALLSQAAALKTAGLATVVGSAMLCWAFGTALAASTLILAFYSTRFVDKSEKEAEREGDHLVTSNNFMVAGCVSVSLSLVFFLAGCVLLARGFAK